MGTFFQRFFPSGGERRKKLPKRFTENYWFELGERLYRESGGIIPDPLQIRAQVLIEALGLPSGPYSAIEIDPKTKRRANPEKDRIIAEYLTNHPGVEVEEGVISLDFRDIYPNGLPQELKEVLDPDTIAIMEIEYNHLKNARIKFEKTNDKFDADVPVHYFRLPGGIDLFMRGYVHVPQWQKKHGEYLREANRHAKIIAIEGYRQVPFGKSLYWLWICEWEWEYAQRVGYEVLIKEAVIAGFNGFFTEIDARDISKIDFESIYIKELSDNFFKAYFEFLEREHPSLANAVGSSKNLKEILIKQSSTLGGIEQRRKTVFKYGKRYFPYPYLTKKGETSFEPTFFEFGQHLFSDALAAIKLLLIAKLMSDGHLPKGPIIDYQGAGHLSSKSFFLKYPQYAMEVVLRTINELMAGKVENLPQIYEVFRKPNWAEIIKEITRLVFKKPEDNPSIPIDRRQLLDYPIDFLAIYGINPEAIMPTDEEIRRTIERLKSIHKTRIIK